MHRGLCVSLTAVMLNSFQHLSFILSENAVQCLRVTFLTKISFLCDISFPLAYHYAK